MMEEALHHLDRHWYISHGLAVFLVLLWSWGAQRSSQWRALALSSLNEPLLLLLLFMGIQQFVQLLFDAAEPGLAPLGLIGLSYWESKMGVFLLMLYHQIGSWIGLLLFWRHFRQSVFFSLLMVFLINYHSIFDVFLAVAWEWDQGRLSYEMDHFIPIRPEPTILIRDWSIWLILGFLALQLAFLSASLFYKQKHTT